jgi:hypothetical protein
MSTIPRIAKSLTPQPIDTPDNHAFGVDGIVYSGEEIVKNQFYSPNNFYNGHYNENVDGTSNENGETDYLKLILTSTVYNVAIQSPLTHAINLSNRLGAKVFLKREDLQPVFSFKLRGAYNKIVQLNQEERKRGVVCCSAGNHGMCCCSAVDLPPFPCGFPFPASSATNDNPKNREEQKRRHKCEGRLLGQHSLHSTTNRSTWVAFARLHDK